MCPEDLNCTPLPTELSALCKENQTAFPGPQTSKAIDLVEILRNQLTLSAAYKTDWTGGSIQAKEKGPVRASAAACSTEHRAFFTGEDGEMEC